jgi:hypothetical protein
MMLAKWATTLAGVAIFATGAAYAESTVGDGARTAPIRHGGGIWKAVVPPNAMQAEFGGRDPIGLASGAKIKADCSLNWIDPDTHKLYCFSSATSQSYFQDWPKRNIERAGRAWHELAAGGS